MRFAEALVQMKSGRPVKIPNWGGYWTWSDTHQTVMMHLKDGAVMDIRQSCRMDYTMAFICRDDWQVVDDICDTMHYRNRGSYTPSLTDHESYTMPTRCVGAFTKGKRGYPLSGPVGPLDCAFHDLGKAFKELTDLSEEND